MMETAGYRIRPGKESEASRLAEIERAAAGVFPSEDLPASMAKDTTLVVDFERAAREDRLIVLATREEGLPVGFAFLEPEPPNLHLEEIDVHPDHARRGLGAALLGAVIEYARSRGYGSISLCTFRHLPWNAPFYARHGFRVLGPGELSADLARRMEEEVASGLDANKRVAMLHSMEDARAVRARSDPG